MVNGEICIVCEGIIFHTSRHNGIKKQRRMTCAKNNCVRTYGRVAYYISRNSQTKAMTVQRICVRLMKVVDSRGISNEIFDELREVLLW